MILNAIRQGKYPKLSSFETGVLSDFLFSAFRKAVPIRLHEIYSRRSEPRGLFVSLKTQSSENDVKSRASTEKQLRQQEDSSTVAYLINSCGLSPESAVLASQKVQFQNPRKPESVLALFSDFGFSKTQISNIVRKRPLILVADPVNTLLPKFKFLMSIGISRSDLARTLSRDPTLLSRSLENQIIPSYNFLKSVLLTDERIVSSMKRTTWTFLEDPSKNMIPNITRLSELAVPQSCIILLLAHYPEAVMQKPEQFSKIVDEVKEMGFDTKKSVFVLAVHALSGKGNKSTRERCYVIYKRWDWSHDVILGAFKKHPQCMMLSEGKIMKGMDFLVNKMGYASQEIAQYPMALFFSLERRIVPRCRVIQVLSSNRMIKDGLSLATVLIPAEKGFLESFVNKYYAEIPQLLSVYEGKRNPEDL